MIIWGAGDLGDIFARNKVCVSNDDLALTLITTQKQYRASKKLLISMKAFILITPV